MVFGLDRIELTAVNFRRDPENVVSTFRHKPEQTQNGVQTSNTLETHAYTQLAV
jgi:hypothetical protein